MVVTRPDGGRSRLPGRIELRRLRFFLWVFAFLGVVGCGNKQEAGEQGSAASDKAVASQLPPSDVTSTPGEEAAPAPMPEPPVEGLYISPYFDEAGTKTELAVAPGQSVAMYLGDEVLGGGRIVESFR